MSNSRTTCAFLIALSFALPARADENATHRLTVVPSDYVLCPGEEAIVLVIVETKAIVDGEITWIRAGNIQLSVGRLQTNPDGSVEGGVQSAKTDEDGGAHQETVRYGSAGTLVFFQVKAVLVDEMGKTIILEEVAQVLSLSTIDCDKLKAKRAKKELQQQAKDAQDLLGTKGKEGVKKGLRTAQETIEGAEKGKHFTAARANAALRELKALEMKGPARVSTPGLTATLAALHAKFDDALDSIGILDDFRDPTRAWFTELKNKSVEELAALFRQVEALNDRYLQHVLSQLGNPPDFGKKVLAIGLTAARKGNNTETRTLEEIAARKSTKADRAVLFRPDARLMTLDGPDRIYKELQNRLTSADEAGRKRLREVMGEAFKSNSRCQTGESLLKYHALYLEQKEVGNAKSAEDTRTKFLDRFQKQLDKEIKEKLDRTPPK